MSNVFSTRNEDAYIQWLRVADMLENIRNYETLTSGPYRIITKEKELKEVPPDGFEQMYI